MYVFTKKIHLVFFLVFVSLTCSGFLIFTEKEFNSDIVHTSSKPYKVRSDIQLKYIDKSILCKIVFHNESSDFNSLLKKFKFPLTENKANNSKVSKFDQLLEEYNYTVKGSGVFLNIHDSNGIQLIKIPLNSASLLSGINGETIGIESQVSMPNISEDLFSEIDGYSLISN